MSYAVALTSGELGTAKDHSRGERRRCMRTRLRRHGSKCYDGRQVEDQLPDERPLFRDRVHDEEVVLQLAPMLTDTEGVEQTLPVRPLKSNKAHAPHPSRLWWFTGQPFSTDGDSFVFFGDDELSEDLPALVSMDPEVDPAILALFEGYELAEFADTLPTGFFVDYGGGILSRTYERRRLAATMQSIEPDLNDPERAYAGAEPLYLPLM